MIIPTLVLVVFMSFALQAATPGDAARVIAGPLGTPTQLREISQELDVNAPITSQFGHYVWDVLHGNFGHSALTGVSVTRTIFGALPPTLSVILVALVLAVLISFPAGVFAAMRRGSWFDRAITSTAAIGLAVPPFIIGVLLVLLVAVKFNLLPATGYSKPSDGLWPWLSHLILPGLALSLVSAAELTRFIRSSFLAILDQDYILAARAFGLTSFVVVCFRTARNAAAPILTIFGLQVGRIISGAVVVEQVFAIPGFGQLAFNSAVNRDIPVIQGIVLVAAVAVVLINLLTDLLYPVFNPRLRG